MKSLFNTILFSSLFSVFLATTSFANSTETALPLTEASAAQVIQTETGAKILSVEQSDNQGATIFHVKALYEDGKIKIHHLDAETGKTTK